MERKTGKDYHREYNDLVKNLQSLDSHTVERLVELSKIHPDAIIVSGSLSMPAIKASSISKPWVERLETMDRIKYIERIEEWSENQLMVVQKKIEI